MKKLLIIFAFTVLACHSRTERINDIKDIEVAEAFTIDLYTKISQKKYGEILETTDDSLKVKLSDIFHIKDSLFGNLLEYKITEAKTTIRENSYGLSYSEYITAITAKYQNAQTDEIVTFVKDNNEATLLKVYTVDQK